MLPSSETVRLRPYTWDDGALLFEAAIESASALSPWLPWCHPAYRRADADAWVARQADHWGRGVEYQFAVTFSSGEYLGGCGINRIDGEHRLANLGYWVRTSRRGQGVAGAAARLAAD